MYKRTQSLFLFLCVFTFSIFAAGRADNQLHEAPDPAGFTQDIDIRELPPGMWNFYMQARDRGGNVTIAGPHNFFIDPASDLPIAQIVNPQPNMRVQGNLNIVGTSQDDDGVAFTMLRVTRGRGGDGEVVRQIRAEGTDFWSYLLDTSDEMIWPDGLYTITAWAVDINGLSGISEDFPERLRRQHQVSWHLDRRRPEINIASHELGAVVSGRITIRGTVWDGNGLDSLAFSTDGGDSFRSVRLRYDRRENIYNFNFNLDTRNFEDGPEIIQLRAYDRMGTEGMLSFLMFMNNTGPEVGIVYPEPGEAVHGIFTVAGYASHGVGLESLSWSTGRETGYFDLLPGNPWWAKEIDIRGQNMRNLDLVITATDVSGNRTVERRRFPVDQAAGMPTITLNEPYTGMVLMGTGMVIAGIAEDNSGVAAILYSLNGGAPVEVPTSGYFQFIVPDVTPGVNTLEVWARNIIDVEGPRTLVRGILAPGVAPRLEIDGVLSFTGRTITDERPFHSGMELSSESGDMLRLMIHSGSALQSITYQLGSLPPVTLPTRGSRGGDFIQDIPIPLDIDFGLVRMEITATDIHGRGTPFEDYIFITDISSRRVIDGHVPVNMLRSGSIELTGINNETSWLTEVRAPHGTRIPITGFIDPALSQGARAVFTLRSVSTGQDLAPVSASVARSGVITANLPADLPADFYQISLFVTPRAAETLPPATGEFWLLRPADGRRVNTARSFNWIMPDTTSAGGGRILLSDNETLVGLYLGRPLHSIEIEGAPPAAFHVFVGPHGRVNLTGIADGDYSIRLHLTDRDGNVFTTPEYHFLVSSGTPMIQLVGNHDGQWLQQQIPVQFRMSSGIGIRSVDFSTDLGTSWQPLLQPAEIPLYGPEAVVERTLNISNMRDGAINVNIRVTDQAGRQSVETFVVYKDTVAPQARLIVPISGSTVNGRIRMGISISEAGRLASVVYENPGSGEIAYGENADMFRPPISVQLYPDPARGGAPLRFLFVELDDTMPLSRDMRFVFTDMAGNISALTNWHFIIDEEAALPVVHISLPLEDEVVTYDLDVSGIAFSPTEVRRIFWRLNNDNYNVTYIRHGFSVSIPLSSLDDNEHSVTIFAEDIFGLQGLPVTRNFRVSLEEPVASVTSPALGEIVGGMVRIEGVSSDGNGIRKIQVSLDNGNSFNTADGTEEWEYVFNSKILPNGTNVVFIRVWDNYDIQAVYASMLVVDNIAPELMVQTPVDGYITTGPLSIAGQALDNLGLESIVIRVGSLEGVEIPLHLAERHADPESPIILENIDLDGLPDGIYNIEVWATDRAQNVTRVSRNVLLTREVQPNFVEIVYPLPGELLHGYFNLYGFTGGADRAHLITLLINDRPIRSEPVADTGFYRFTLSPADLTSGANTLVARSHVGGTVVESEPRVIEYQPYGPWVTIDTVIMGDFIYNRPWLMGRAGFTLSEGEIALLEDRDTDRETRNALRARTLDFVELSFDNGRNFFRASNVRGEEHDWRHRLETQDMAEGSHFVIVRANMANGETVVTRLMMQVNRTPPIVRLISPQQGGRYNTTLGFSALAQSDTELDSLSFHLRRGSWAAYEVPGFIRGLYVEGTIPPFVAAINNNAPGIFRGGPTFFDIGMGLSFFDDNVKLQFNYGQMTQSQFNMLGGDADRGMRYGGNVLSLKILANVYNLPFATVIGPDWDWLSASFAIGAKFSLFSETQSGNSTWISALVAQAEFPRVTLPNRERFRTFSLFTEGQLWFMPTDMDAAQLGIDTVIPSVIMGVRAYIF